MFQYHLANYSRTFIQKLIEQGDISVNGKPVKPGNKLKPGDIIHVIIPEPVSSDITPENLNLKIVYEDEHLLVINKQAGVVVHPAAGHHTGTLVNALLYHRADQLSGIGGEKKPGIVHRLDKDTSGLLLVAKSDAAHQHLSQQLKARTLTREYHAVVWGHLEPEAGTIHLPLGRHRRDRKKISVNPPGKQRDAITHYQVIDYYPLCSHVRVNLETGRTHQIRVHFTYMKHPVLGDPTYGGRDTYVTGLDQKKRVVAQRLLKMIDRQALHAKKIAFFHPVTHSRMEFDSELPEDFQNVLNLLNTLKISVAD